MLREDKIHPEYGGNKWRKLYYNLLKAKQLGHDTLLTFGGAWSNHIAATAAACRDEGLKSIGVIRGEEPLVYSDTLAFAKSCGMQFFFVDRASYREKNNDYFKQWLHDQLGRFYLIPEGGSNYLGVQGCMEIIGNVHADFDYIACAAGTGATAAGISLSLKSHQKLLVFPALKGGEFMAEEILTYRAYALGTTEESGPRNFEILSDYHFGGYAKTTPELIAFIRAFYRSTHIKLDPVYTGKMMFGLDDVLKKKMLPPDSKILALHSGGLQGIPGIEKRIGENLFL